MSTPAPPAGPQSIQSLGAQLREVLPTRRLLSVSVCDHEANVLWLSEGALGPDEHILVVEALEALAADSSLPCHETALEDGRLGVFLPVRAPTGTLVGAAMILADSKSIGDDTLERITAAPVRTIMQRLAVLLKPSETLVNGHASAEPEALEEAEEAEEAAQPETAAPESAVPEVVVPELELSLVEEVAAAAASGPASYSDDEDSETIITAAEIASILELEEPPPAPAVEPAAAPTREPARPAAASAPPAPPSPVELAPEDSGMVRLEFLAEPPVVRPAPNPSAVARKLQAASKVAAAQPARALRPQPPPPAPVARAAAPAAAPAGPAAKAPVSAAPAGKPASPAAPGGKGRNPFEPIPPNSRLSLVDDDVVVLFDSDPVKVPTPAVRPPPAAAAPAAPPPAAKAAPAPPNPVQPTRIAPSVRAVAPVRSAPAVRVAPAPRAAPPASTPTVRAAPPAPTPTPAPAPAAAPTPAAAAPAPVAAPAPAPVAAAPAPAPAVAAASSAADAAPPIDLLPFAKLRPGAQSRRFQVQPRVGAGQRDAAAIDEQTLQQLLGWLAAHRAAWTSVPTNFTVNLSIATLEDERFPQKVGAALNAHGIAGETLGFEIAEPLCVQNRAKVERFIAQCEKLGAWIAIDDFSFDSQVLPLLRSKALRMLKLDARLTAAALRDKLSQAVVVATVQAAKVLGIHCSAKKADTQALLQYLTAIGVDFAQGTTHSRPVPLEQLDTVSETKLVRALQIENPE